MQTPPFVWHSSRGTRCGWPDRAPPDANRSPVRTTVVIMGWACRARNRGWPCSERPWTLVKLAFAELLPSAGCANVAVDSVYFSYKARNDAQPPLCT